MQLLLLFGVVPRRSFICDFCEFEGRILFLNVRPRKGIVASGYVSALIFGDEGKPWFLVCTVRATSNAHYMVGAEILLAEWTISSPHALFIGLDVGDNRRLRYTGVTPIPVAGTSESSRFPSMLTATMYIAKKPGHCRKSGQLSLVPDHRETLPSQPPLRFCL